MGTKQTKLLVGTSKGVFMYTSDEARKEWTLHGPFLHGWEAYSVLGDRESSTRLYAGTSHAAYGATIRISDDNGATWRQVVNGPRYAPETGFPLRRFWQLTHGVEPGTIYAGAEDAGIFVSYDRGENWRELDALTKHPTRPHWFGGAGGMGLHTILVHPTNPKRIWTATSAVGVFRTDDGGETWQVCNRGLNRAATGQPDDSIGYCVHKMALDPVDPDVLYMQEHCGVFISRDGGDSWLPYEEGLSMHGDDRPFGFPMAVGPNRDQFIIPLESSEKRSMLDGQLLVWSRRPEWDEWKPIGDVVPNEPRHVSVLRDAMTVDSYDEYGLYIGTSSGELFCSLDRGVSWQRLPGQLSRILTVKSWITEV